MWRGGRHGASELRRTARDARAAHRPSRRAAALAFMLCAAVAWPVRLVAAAPAVAAPVPATGEIRGTVVDRTPAAHPVGGQPVTLEIVERGSSSRRQTETDGAGRFAFAGLPVGGMRVFLLRVTYGGVQYDTRVALTPDAPARAVQMAVYEATRDRANIRGAVFFAVVETGRGALRISVVQRLVNGSDRAVVTDDDPLVFPLPPGAEAVQFIGGWRDPRFAAGAIADTIPVPPGVLQLGYAFGLEPRAHRLAVPWTLPYGAADVEVLVADPAVRLSGPGLRAAPDIVDAGRRFARWSAGPVAAGGRLTITLDGVPVSDDRWPLIAAALLAASLAAGLAITLSRRPSATG